MNFNKVIIGGNLTRDPELSYTPKGTAVGKFGLAINRKWKSESGEAREDVTFVDVAAFGKTAELINQYFAKGNPILLEGRLKLDSWEDKQTGAKRSKLNVIAESVTFVGGQREAGGDGQGQPSAARPQAPRRAAPPKSEDGPPPDDDDVPF